MAPGQTIGARDRELINLRQELQRLRKRFVTLGRLGQVISTSLDLPTVLQTVVDAACELTDARYGALGVFDSSGRITQFITHGLGEKERARIGALPQGMGVLGWLQAHPQPVRLSNLSKHPRSVGFPANHPAMKTFMGAPLHRGDERLGNLYLTEKAGGAEFTTEDEDMLVLFAAQAAIAIHNAQLHQDAGDARNKAEQDRVHAEDERKQLEGLVDVSPIGVAVIEAGTQRFVVANHELLRILGLDSRPEALTDATIRSLKFLRMDGREIPRDETATRRALFEGKVAHAEEMYVVKKGGQRIPVLVNATPIKDRTGRIISAVTVLQDLTPLHEMEKLRNEFLGMVSHELKTPLTAIKGSAAMVLGSNHAFGEAETRDLFQIIDEQADRLRDLVDNLLDITRIESGTLSVRLGTANLPSIIEEAKKMFSRSGGQHEVVVHTPASLPAVKADARRISQVVANLLTNAAKFSPVTLPITIDVEGQGDTVLVYVRDKGRGIPKDKLPHLFKKFSQVHDDAGHKVAGSGLGLAICKGIVEAHGGRIRAESAGEGKGAVFTFTLPITVDAAVPSAQQQSATSPKPAAGPSVTQRAAHVGHVRPAGQRTRIMAVDDEPQILRFLQRALEEAGYQPVVTGDPKQVVKLVELEEPDLLLLDVNLPGATGFDLLKRIREFSGVPVIFVTARDSDEDAVRALKAGADDYITKPFSPSELLARIEASLRRRVLSDTVEVKPPFTLGGLMVDFADRRVTVDSKSVALSATEYKLLYELATNAGRVLTHDQILKRVWGPEYEGESELVRSFMRNLRKKLGDDARKPRYIQTEPQVGYRMPRG